MITITYKSVGSNALKLQNNYNGKVKTVQQHKIKWRIKESYKEFYKTLGEGMLFLSSVVVTAITIYIWFY